MSETFKSGRGGARPNSGRPAKPEGDKAKKRGITLNEELVIKAMALIGTNKPNMAIRKLVEQAIAESLKKSVVTSNE